MPKRPLKSNGESEQEYAGNDEVGNLHPAEISDCKRADRMAEGIVTNASCTFYKKYDGEQRTGNRTTC
jgi:hypothetical protein